MTAALWWQRLPQRVLDEDARLQQLVADGTLTQYAWARQGDGQLWLTADIAILPDKIQAVELRFPERYPGECPAIRPLPYGTPLSGHQFRGDGVLCLELGPDNWHSRFMAADLLASAWKLLVYELLNTIKHVPIPSRHVDTIGMDIRGEFFRLIASQAARDALDAAGAITTFHYTSALENGAHVSWLAEAPPGTSIADVPPLIASREKRTGIAIHLNDDALPPPEEVAALRDYLQAVGVAEDTAKSLDGMIVFLRPESMRAKYILSSDVHSVAVIADRRVEADDRRPAPVAVAAATARVAIVGLGSLGSKIATSLARTGITKFVLVDGDALLPENVVRHDSDFLSAGLMKVEAAAARIRRVATAAVTVETFHHDVADGTNPAVHAKTVAALASADLLIDATANPDAFNFLADLASEERRQLAWGEVFAGGFGGYIAYATPERTPCPSCVRAAFHALAANWPPAPLGASEPYAADAPADAAPVIATDADVGVIAAALSALSLRLLTNDLDDHPPLLFVGLRAGWIFERALDSRAIPVRQDDFACDRCWTRPAAADDDTQKKVEALLTSNDAHHPPPS